MWIRLRACAAPSVNGSRTIRHKPKFVSFLRKHKGNFAHCPDRFLHVCEPYAWYLHFLRFFNTDWSMFVDCALTLWFTSRSRKIDLLCTYCELYANHTMWSRCVVCAKLYTMFTHLLLYIYRRHASLHKRVHNWCPQSCIFMFVKGICHSTSGDISDAYVIGIERGWWT